MNSLSRDRVPRAPPAQPRARGDNSKDLHKKNQDKDQTSISLIQSNSIQNQFTILSNQRDKFIRERDEAQKELKQIHTAHQDTKTENNNLIESNRKAKERLGQKMEKLATLKEEESRLSQLTKNEFHAIHDCTNHSKFLEKKKEDATKQYTAEMNPLNFELAAILDSRIQKNTERHITVQSVEGVVAPEFDKALLDKNKPQLLNQRDNLYESINLLRSATKRRSKCASRLRELRRATVQQPSGVRNEKNGSALFYGSSQDESFSRCFPSEWLHN